MAMKYFGPFHNYIRPLTGAILGDFLGQNRERLAQVIVLHEPAATPRGRKQQSNGRFSLLFFREEVKIRLRKLFV